MPRQFIPAAVVGATLAVGCTSPNARPGLDASWIAYNGHASGDHYSRLTQINRSNVHRLRQAWRFDSTERGDPQTNPLIVGRTLYGYTPALKVIALDAATGTQRWTFDPGLQGTLMAPGVRFTGPSRGLSFWSDGTERRLFAGAMNYLFALDPDTGQPIRSFGADGAVDLRRDLRGAPEQHYVSLTSPGVIYRDLIIVGFRTSENPPAPPGDIRAYDVRTGEQRWSFHTIPHAGEPGAETWPQEAGRESGGANDWSGLALDEKRGIVYAPTGSAVLDFYGAERIGDNLYANTLLALDAATGRRLWHFQAVHHDLWDRDLPSPPSLLTLRRGGRSIDAVAQPTKQGFLFVFDRANGSPISPIEERPVAASDVPGERSSPTQPWPTAPEPFARQRLTADLLTQRTPEAADWARRQFVTFRSDGQFVPLTPGQQTVIFPGFDGGAEWGGAAVDVRTGVIYINSNDVAWTGGLVKSVPGGSLGAALYQAQCATCHGAELKGSPPQIASLVDVGQRMSPAQIAEVIRSGRGRMPPFAALQSFALAGLVEYVRSGGVETQQPSDGAVQEQAAQGVRREMTASLADESWPIAFRFSGYSKFTDPEGYPAVAPPWGTLSAIDLNTGKYRWKIPLGEYPELAARGMRDTGSENYGGPIVTAGGVLFIGATIYDHRIRAFDSARGKLLWQAELPFAATATPATYMVDGKQYVVIATNNARNPQGPQGAAYVAFCLP
jgi:quinoprotein glucose dehydrogenase